MMGLVFTVAPSCKKKSKSSSPAPVVEEPVPEPVTPTSTDATTTTAISGFNCTSSPVLGIGDSYSMIIDTTQNKVQLTKDGQSLIYTMVASADKVFYAPESTRYDLTLIDANGTAVTGDAGYIALEPDTINYFTKQDRGYRNAWAWSVPFDSKSVKAKFSCK